MASTNQSPEYLAAEKKFYLAATDDEKIVALEEMIRQCPKHKSGESMRANLKTRYKKLKEKIETKKKSGAKSGIKKAELQAVIVGLVNSGKSSFLSALTNAKPEIASFQYTTSHPFLGSLDYERVKIQLIDMPAVESEYFDQGLANTADTILIVLETPQQINEISPFLEKARGEKLFVVNKIDLLSEAEKRKISAFMSSKKLNFVLFSCKTLDNIEELKRKIWISFKKIRVYTKQPGKAPDSDPVIMKENSTVKDIAEKIFHGLSSQVKETRITGPSSKFPNQLVSLEHVLKDKDIVEFKV